DIKWEPIKEERLEEPKEGWMLGESNKRLTRISSRMLIVGLVPQSRVTLVKARSNPSEAQHKFISSVISTRRGRGARVAFEDEFGAAEEREVSCEAQQGRSGVKRKLFGSYRNNMCNEPILALPKGSDNFVVMRGARNDGQSERTFRTLKNMFRACVRNLVVVGILTFYEAEIGESKIIRLELEQDMTKVVVIKERLKEAKDRVVRFGKICELAPRYIGPFEILERIGPVAYRLRLPDELSIENYLSGVKTLSKPEIALIL
nr:hypothetical protein [Tanacetum cinerariifolium]